MIVAIVKYNAGNIRSVLFALERIGMQATVTDDPETLLSADKVIFPGVGEARTAMNYLKERKLDKLIVSLKQPVLGICLGMQLMCEYSEENDTPCLGIFKNVMVKKFISARNDFKIPQIGWNTLEEPRSELFLGVEEGSYCYFVHGYFAGPSTYTIATTHYSEKYSSALHKDNFWGVQFHPEKSATTGEKILLNFLRV